jgi:hypothetical protein
MQAAQSDAPAIPKPTAPQAPGTPVDAQSPTPTVTIDGVPQSFGDVRALRAQRSELSNQLQSAQRRRNEVVDQLKNATEAERPGLEARLKLLDQRILEIEGEISRTGDLIAKTPGNLLSSTQTQPPIQGLNVNSGDLTGIVIVFTIFVLTPIAVTISRLIWKRGSNPPPKKVDQQSEERMRRLEAGVDAIAIEVERISEGQRFITKLMSEREKQAVLPNREG